MINTMHQDIFKFYLLNSSRVNEKSKRAMRKTITKYFKRNYPSRDWHDLTHIEKTEFMLITMRDYMLNKVKYPNGDDYPPGKTEQELHRKIKKKISEELKNSLTPLKEIENHNKEMDILQKKFFDDSLSDDENYMAYQKLCKYHLSFFPKIEPPSFEEWKNNPLTLFELREEYKLSSDREYSDQKNLSQTSTEVDELVILKEVIECILKKLDIKIDTNAIKRCLEATRYVDDYNYESLDDTPKTREIIAAFKRLSEHDFIINEDID